MEYLIKLFSDQGQVVLDPFMGSGTTGIACKATGRDFIGFELDCGYFDISQKRISEAQVQTEMDLS
jgi:DNA modification methylase